MPRPRKFRIVQQRPVASFYKPQGAPLGRLECATLSVEGLEALRLADAEGLDQASAARTMDVSPATFCRILAQARATVARALSGGWAIRIEGGDFRLADEAGHGGHGRGHGWRGGRGRCNQTEEQSCPIVTEPDRPDRDQKARDKGPAAAKTVAARAPAATTDPRDAARAGAAADEAKADAAGPDEPPQSKIEAELGREEV